jgi:Zn-dependent protease
LTFNPIKYTHPVYSILLPLLFLLMGGIGLPGGAVYIERWRLKNAKWESAVSLAGPASNAFLALTLSLILQIDAVQAWTYSPALAFLALLQVCAVVLNLIPLPPFDGFGAIEPFLPMETRMKIMESQGMLGWLVLAVLWTVPAVSRALWFTIDALAWLIAIPFQLAIIGQSQFLFWR